jgi:hypothetical protein
MTLTHTVERADALEWLASLPADSADLLLTSPPYSSARLYLENGEDLGIARDTEEWVKWMVEVCHAARRACKGLCAFVVEGRTRDYRYNCGPFLLAADLHRADFHLRKPPVYRRVGIPGSGGPDWLRNDYEPVVCFTRGGKLPWSDNTAMGHPPRWAPGGAMSSRLSDGSRVNKWGGSGKNTFRMKDGSIVRQTGEASRPPESAAADEPEGDAGLFGDAEGPPAKAPVKNAFGVSTTTTRRRTGTGERETQKPSRMGKAGTPRRPNGDRETQGYEPPVLANPGNVIQETYTAEEVAALMGEAQNLIDCNTGGGQMGSDLAHENEAPFSEALCEFFVLSFCPPGGLVLDPFSGSGTTASVAKRHGRNFKGCDLRQSQVDLSLRRLAGESTLLFT